MAHSIELLFDDVTDGVLRGRWDALAAAGLPSQVRVSSPTNRPHVTVTVADGISAAVDADLRGLAGLLPLPCLLGAPVVFGHLPALSTGRGGDGAAGRLLELGEPRGRRRLTLAQLVVASAPLLELHRAVHTICVPHLTPGPAPHSLPGQWIPHATLARRMSAEQLASAIAAVPGISAECRGAVVGLRRWDGDARVEHVLIS
ncbi:MAG: 2'-5' RNA ligase family protein [Mycobacterium sp.]